MESVVCVLEASGSGSEEWVVPARYLRIRFMQLSLRKSQPVCFVANPLLQ
jgi:hypothetical protein